MNNVARGRLFKVECNIALAPVVEFERVVEGGAQCRGTIAAIGVAARRFDLDHIGAGVGKKSAAGGSSQPIGHLQDADPVERALHFVAAGRYGVMAILSTPSVLLRKRS